MPPQQDYITFWNGQKMPLVGLGTWQSSKEEIQAVVNAALEAGYRHIDTAYNYMNEDAIGEVLQKWIQSGKVKREELFIVTKLPMIGNRPEWVEKYLKKSLKALRLEYVDLYLIHSPVGLLGQDDLDVFPRDADGNVALDMTTDLLKLWKSLENQVDAGLVKSLGVSNVNEEQIERIVKNARIKPANLQVELHVEFQQKSLRECCAKHGITICAYASLGSPGRKQSHSQSGLNLFYGLTWPAIPIPDLLNHPVVTQTANAHNKSSDQVLLKYLCQLGIAVIPKSTNPNRVKSNFQIHDFTLSISEMAQLRDLDLGDSGRTFDFEGFFKGAVNHPENPYPN